MQYHGFGDHPKMKTLPISQPRPGTVHAPRKQEWTRGCYNANPGPCGWIHFGQALAASIGPITWAATETATRWSGYLEGAVDAGLRAAAEVLDDLS